MPQLAPGPALDDFFAWMLRTQEFAPNTARMYRYVVRSLIHHAGSDSLNDTEALREATSMIPSSYWGYQDVAWRQFHLFAVEQGLGDQVASGISIQRDQRPSDRWPQARQYTMAMFLLQTLAGKKETQLSTRSIRRLRWHDVTDHPEGGVVIKPKFTTSRSKTIHPIRLVGEGVELLVDFMRHAAGVDSSKPWQDIPFFPLESGGSESVSEKGIYQRLRRLDTQFYTIADLWKHRQDQAYDILKQLGLLPVYLTDDYDPEAEGPAPGADKAPDALGVCKACGDIVLEETGTCRACGATEYEVVS